MVDGGIFMNVHMLIDDGINFVEGEEEKVFHTLALLIRSTYSIKYCSVIQYLSGDV